MQVPHKPSLARCHYVELPWKTLRFAMGKTLLTPLSPYTCRSQKDSWRSLRSPCGSSSTPSLLAKMLTLPGRRPYTRSSANLIVKSPRFSNPPTAYKSCSMSRNFSLFLNVWKGAAALEGPRVHVWTLVSCSVDGRHGHAMKAAGYSSSSSSPLFHFLSFPRARGQFFSFCLSVHFCPGPLTWGNFKEGCFSGTKTVGVWKGEFNEEGHAWVIFPLAG